MIRSGGVTFLRRLFGEKPPAPPVLVRVRASSGAVPETVALDVTWASGRRESRTVVAAQGLCILPWRESERGVELVVRALGGRADLRLSARDNAGGTAHEIRLEGELAAE